MQNNHKDTDTLPRKRLPRMKSAGDVHHFLARIIRELYRGEIEESRASKIGYLCNILLKAIDEGDLEKRIAALEDSLKSRSKDHDSLLNLDTESDDLESNLDVSLLESDVN